MTDRTWSEELTPNPETAALMDGRLAEYGLDDLNLGDVASNLFGYDLEMREGVVRGVVVAIAGLVLALGFCGFAPEVSSATPPSSDGAADMY